MSDQEKAELLTTHVQPLLPDWTYEKSLEWIREAKKSGDITDGISQDPWVIIRMAGDTLFVNGKEITGTLGSQITYGDHSPIVIGSGNVLNNGSTTYGNDDQIAVGNSTNVSNSGSATPSQSHDNIWLQYFLFPVIVGVIVGIILAILNKKYKWR